jgi:hypothetical protein
VGFLQEQPPAKPSKTRVAQLFYFCGGGIKKTNIIFWELCTYLQEELD